MAGGGRTGSSGGERDTTTMLASRYFMAGERTGTPPAGRGRTMPGGMSRGCPTRVSGCRTGMCLMVECRTGGDCARGSRGHGSGVIQSGGTGRAGRDESCRAGAVRAGLSTRIMCVSVGRKPCGMRTGGEGRSVSVRGGRAVVGGRGLGRRAGWHRSVELDGMSGAVIAVGRQLGGRAGWDLSAAPSG